MIARISFLIALVYWTSVFSAGTSSNQMSSITTQPKDLPIFQSFTNDNPKSKEAIAAAQEAFFIQSGITQHYQEVKEFVYKKGKKVEHTTATAIDNNTPLDSKALFFALGIGYEVGVKKRVEKSFRDPFLKSMHHTIGYNFQNNSTYTGLSVSFP